MSTAREAAAITGGALAEMVRVTEGYPYFQEMEQAHAGCNANGFMRRAMG